MFREFVVVFDGDAPHRPGGCIAQAWSVAELLRLYTLLEDRRQPAIFPYPKP
ncbi:MAG: amylo-alpha-1,6-glucosidase [Thermodesulfobacteriota bacterium]